MTLADTVLLPAPPHSPVAERTVLALRVPYREGTQYGELREKYMRRDDVAWGSDEEALVKEIVGRDPKFFQKSLPFMGYLQFLYEGRLKGGDRITSLQVDVPWAVSGMHSPS